MGWRLWLLEVRRRGWPASTGCRPFAAAEAACSLSRDTRSSRNLIGIKNPAVDALIARGHADLTHHFLDLAHQARARTRLRQKSALSRYCLCAKMVTRGQNDPDLGPALANTPREGRSVETPGISISEKTTRTSGCASSTRNASSALLACKTSKPASREDRRPPGGRRAHPRRRGRRC
jgi:hypothetical protein